MQLANDKVPRGQRAPDAMATDPPVSEAQRRAMFAAKEGHSKIGIPSSVGKEFAEADPGGKLPERAKDMTGGDWRGVVRGLLKFFMEEADEPEHAEESKVADAEDPSGKLSETTREKIGEPGSEKREDMPEGVFLGPHETYPVKEKQDGEWKYTRNLLVAAAKRARLQGRNDIARRADAIREREFGEGEDEATLAPSSAIPAAARRGKAKDVMVPKDYSFALRGKVGTDIALDRALGRSQEFAVDREASKTYDADGRLHVDSAIISKATVNDYLGSEINGVMKDEPGWKMLDPEKKYKLLRDPKELEKAVDSFNGLPLLWTHEPATAEDHPTSLTVGASGTDATFEYPFLKNSLVIWPKYATEAIDSGEKKELSCGYAYKAKMEPGVFEGQDFDGRMVQLRGNHIALVVRGRVGAEAAIDRMFNQDREWLLLEKEVLGLAA